MTKRNHSERALDALEIVSLDLHEGADTMISSAHEVANGALSPTGYDELETLRRAVQALRVLLPLQIGVGMPGRVVRPRRHHREARTTEHELGLVEELERRGGKAAIEAQAIHGSAPGAAS